MLWKILWKLCKRNKPWARLREFRGDDMHTGIIIEQLIATVARVDAKVEKARRIYTVNLQTPAMPFREAANLLARPGVM
jgi:hypothetical protein